MSASRLSRGLIERAFAPPHRPAPLAALAVELRRPGVWAGLCRLAAERQPAWLEDRLLAGDALLSAIGGSGDPRRDEASARAVCGLALAICGRRDETLALADAAAITGELPPADFSGLEPEAHPGLTDLIADLRSPREGGSSAQVSTVVSVAGRGARGAATVEALPGRAPGLRLDVSMRLFSPPTPALEEALQAAAARLGPMSASLLARVEGESGEPAGGDACAAAVVLAAEAARKGRSVDERVLVVGALSTRDERLRTPRAPTREEARAVLEQARGDAVVLTGIPLEGSGAKRVETMAALRRAARRPRRRLAVVAAALTVAMAGLAAALIVPSLGPGVDADRDASRAEDLLLSSPTRAAMLAARALAAHEDGQTDEAALRVMAANPLTEATGQEQGSLLAVAVDGGSVVTTVSSAGRATRWDLRDGRLRPRSAIKLPPEASLEAMSPGGRWLLLRTPILYEEALLVDTSGRRATRLLAAPEESAFAISEGERPLVARGDGSRLLLDEGSAALPAEGEISTLAFSPSGRLLAVGNRAGGSAVFVRSGKGWKILRPWREESAIGEIERIEVDDRGTTLANLESSVGPGVRWQSLGRGTDPHSVEGEGWLGGRSLTLEPLEHRLKLVDQRPRASDLAITVPFPIDGATVRPVALSPAGDRAVVAAPEGHFSVLDLRRVRPVRGSVVAGSVEVRGDRLSMLEANAAGSRLLAWNLGDLSPPERGPWLPGQPRVAVRAAGGSLLVHSGDGDAVFVRSGSDGSVIGRLRSRGEESWSSVTATPGGDLVAAADERSGAVTLWRLRRRPEGDVSGRVVLRTERPSDGRLEFPAPLAISPDGDRLVYGTGAGLFLRDLGNGREWPLPSPGEGETIRLRFDPASGRRLLASTSEAVIEFSGDRLRSQRRLVPLAAYDAVSLPTGATAAATGLGVQLYTRSGQAVEVDDGVTGEGLGPGTLSASADNATLVPHTGGLPLVALRVDPPTPERLCALAGGRALTADGSCGPPPPMPEPHPPTGTPEDRSGDVTLSTNGLGWLRLGEHLPAPAARLPAYFDGECAVRTLPGRGAAIITRAGQIESIALFQSPYAEDSARFRTDVEVATDRGLTPSAASSAAEAYGRADERSGSRGTWFLGRTSGGRSVLSVDDDYESEIPLTMSIEGARCEDLE